ncbi:unnamed protein product [Somion occarium]|uniref:UDENN domain-containing protein n=1 Tax=Somion occarium TaxID=3059160 RepID=A0ABP1DWB7_9APHY
MSANNDDQTVSNSNLKLESFLDTDPSPLNSHFLLDPAPSKNQAASRSSFSSENDTASQRSISLSSPSGSPATKSISLDDDDDHARPTSFYAHTTPTPDLDSDLKTNTSHTTTSPRTPLSIIRQSLSFASSAAPQPSAISSTSTHTITETPSRDSTAYPLSLSSELSSDVDDDRSMFMKRFGDDDGEEESPVTSLAPSLAEKLETKPTTLRSTTSSPPVPALTTSLVEEPKTKMSLPTLPPRVIPPESLSQPTSPPPPVASLSPAMSLPTVTYPPKPIQIATPDRQSVASFATSSSGATSYSKKARPESLLVQIPEGRLVIGMALVDFNHLIEFSRGDIFGDEEIAKILPFLALPDGAHLTTEDYSYFHLVPSSPNPTTLFGISCNRQIKSSELLYKEADVTRSTVQKAVVVVASKPVFGPIRDRLGVITRTLFAQCDFTDLSILDAFYESLEGSLRSQLTESGLYMGTSLRELVHTFRQRTLVLLKALMLQKKIMFYGHPVEKLCTYQYSLVTLVPGLLHNLDDSGSPPLDSRAQALQRPTELKTSDHKSMRAFVGLPLELFGKDAFFQPYLPLQQMDLLKDTKSWLCGCTNSIVAQQKEVDLLINIEANTFEFRDPRLERSAGLTAADRKWMDDIVKDVNDGWVEQGAAGGMHFKGSDDYLRQKFDEYISGALSCVKYADFMSKGQNNGVMISDGSGDPNSVNDFNMFWISEFKKTNAYEVWNRVTDPVLFDIVEPRHPCGERPSVVADIGLRLSEGIQELKIDQQLAPAREAVTRTLTAGSTGFLKAVEGVRGRWMQRSASSSSSTNSTGEATSATSSPVEVNKSDISDAASSRSRQGSIDMARSDAGTPSAAPTNPPSFVSGIRPLSLAGSMRSNTSVPSTPEPKATLSSWGAGIGSFFSQRTARLSTPRSMTASATTPPRQASPSPAPSRKTSMSVGYPVNEPLDLGIEELKPRNLDQIRGDRTIEEHEPAGTGIAM